MTSAVIWPENGLRNDMSVAQWAKTLEDEDVGVESNPSTPGSTIKAKILRSLSSIQASGSFAASATIVQVPPTGLFVEGIGAIRMPREESQARQLISKCRQAPYGLKSETLVDTSVRNTWELDASQFTFKDTRWLGFEQRIFTSIAKALGINTPIKAEIYKMLIYEKGAMFKTHKDTEKIPGMFGTLVISLPSAHEGGDVVLKHCGRVITYKSSKFQQSFACWYSDVSHEVLPVTSGYRWVLTYNLAVDPTAVVRPSAGLQRESMADIRSIITQWLADGRSARQNAFVYHVLEHNYTEGSIQLSALKGHDLAQVQALHALTKELPFEIFFAFLEKEDLVEDEGYGGDYYDRYDHYEDTDDEEPESPPHLSGPTESNYRVKTLVDLSGRQVVEDMSFVETDILQANVFEDLEMDDEELHYAGNEGGGATQWYRLTAVAIVPHDAITDLFKDDTSYMYRSKTSAGINYLSRMCLRPEVPKSLIEALIHFCKLTWKPYPETSQGQGMFHASYMPMKSISYDMCDVLKSALVHHQYAFFEEATANAKFISQEFFRWVRQWLVTNSEPGQSLESIRKGLSACISTYSYFNARVKAIRDLAPLSSDNTIQAPAELAEPLLDFARTSLRASLTLCPFNNFNREDGMAMVDLACYFDDPSGMLRSSVFGKVHSRQSLVPFMLGFLSRLHHHIAGGTLSDEESKRFYRRLAASLITETDFKEINSFDQFSDAASHKRIRFEHGYGATVFVEVHSRELTTLFSELLKMSTEDNLLALPLFDKLIADAPRMREEELTSLWLPFLQSIVPILACYSTPLNTPIYQKLFSSFIRTYLSKFVGNEPVKDANLVRPSVACSCVDCKRMTAFLKSPTLKVESFRMAEPRRKHLLEKLWHAKVDCKDQTVKSGSPHTLVVTKTFEQHARDHRQWTIRLRQASEQLQMFDQGQLEMLLGSDYQVIATHVWPKRKGRGGPQPLRQVSAQSYVPAPVVGVKRKEPSGSENVIDLTSD